MPASISRRWPRFYRSCTRAQLKTSLAPAMTLITIPSFPSFLIWHHMVISVTHPRIVMVLVPFHYSQDRKLLWMHRTAEERKPRALLFHGIPQLRSFASGGKIPPPPKSQTKETLRWPSCRKIYIFSITVNVSSSIPQPRLSAFSRALQEGKGICDH